MTAGELFVKLGIKGSEKTIQALTGVTKGMGEISSMSLEAKAAILGVVYTMERLMASSAQTGTNLVNFGQYTGLSIKQLQQWQYAARQAGVSSEELTGSVKTVQNAMTNMLLGKGAPSGMAMVAKTVGFDVKRARDTFYVLQQLQKFAQRVSPDVGNAMLNSFGLSEGTIAAMRRNAFRPEIMNRAPTFGDREAGQLDKVNVAMSNLGTQIQMAFGHFTAKHGIQFVNDLTKVTTEVIKLAEAFIKLAETIKLMQWVGKIFEGWAMIFGGITTGVNSISGAFSDTKKRDKLGKGVGGFFQEMPGVFKAMFEDAGAAMKQAIAPSSPAIAGSSSTSTITQHLHFQHEGKDHQRTGESVKKATQDAYRQRFAQAQGS